jgi:hypothetical protein
MTPKGLVLTDTSLVLPLIAMLPPRALIEVTAPLALDKLIVVPFMAIPGPAFRVMSPV